MADVFTPEKRRQIMSAVKGRDTKPELVVRRLLHGMGYRYWIHKKGLPGRPDIYFTKRRKAIFVHGCFWHGHKGCKRGSLPATNVKFWTKKIGGNMARDERNLAALADREIDTLVVWECETRDASALADRLERFLGAQRCA